MNTPFFDDNPGNGDAPDDLLDLANEARYEGNNELADIYMDLYNDALEAE